MVYKVSTLKRPYNSVHIRRGDKSKACNSVESTINKIKIMNNAKPENKKFPWVVFTNADIAYIEQFKISAKNERIKVVMEHDFLPNLLPDARSDNYLKFAVFSCLHAFAYSRLETFHTMTWAVRIY